MKAMIFAAGLGTRLRPLTDTRPKALVEVAGKPMLEHRILSLKAAGATRIVVNVHHFAEQIKDFLEANGNFGMDIAVSDETDLLRDTGGGIRFARPLLDDGSGEGILIHNVDIFHNLDLKRFYESNPVNEDIARLLVSDRPTKRYFLFDDTERLVGWTNIETKEVRTSFPNLDTSRCHRLAFDGVHIISPKAFELMKGWPDRFSIVDFYLQAASRSVIRGVQVPGLKMTDIGKMETLTGFTGF